MLFRSQLVVDVPPRYAPYNSYDFLLRVMSTAPPAEAKGAFEHQFCFSYRSTYWLSEKLSSLFLGEVYSVLRNLDIKQ
jgi:hypothetical protein